MPTPLQDMVTRFLQGYFPTQQRLQGVANIRSHSGTSCKIVWVFYEPWISDFSPIECGKCLLNIKKSRQTYTCSFMRFYRGCVHAYC